MNIVATLSTWQHTFTAWIAKQYQSFRKEEPTLIALGDRVFPYVRNAIQIAFELEGSPAMGTAVANAMDAIHAKIDVAASLLYDFGPTPSVVSAIATVQQDIAQIESVAGLKSDKAKDAVSKAANSLAALSTAVQGALASATPPVG